MKKGLLILISIFILILNISLISASDVLVWQGQYYTGTTFNVGTYEFNFTVYDALTGGNICFSNTTALTTGNFGEWRTEQSGVNSACGNASKDYYLNININGTDQTPRRRLLVWNYLRKDTDEITSGKIQTNTQIIAPIIQADTQIITPLVNATQIIAPIIQADTQIITPLVNATQIIANNLTTTDYGFFSFLGSLVNRITKLWIVDINASGNIETSGNVSAQYFKGDGSLLTNLPAGGGESDPQWSSNFTNMQTDCPSGNYAYSVNGNGTLKCRQDQTGSGNGFVPVYLESNLNASGAANYTIIFTIALTPGKMNIVQAYLAQSSSVAGVAIQNRAITSESGPVGYCSFATQTQAASQVIDNIAVSNNSADTGQTSMGLDINVPFINKVVCTVIADASQKNLIIQFDSENANTVTTYAGSYYINSVN